MCVIIIVGRLIAVWSAHGLFSICSKKVDYTTKELCFISFGGMIRGAIAFGLVLKIPEPTGSVNDFKERGAVVTTTLACVIFTTVVFGSFMPVVQRLLIPQIEKTASENESSSPSDKRTQDSTDKPGLSLRKNLINLHER